MIRKSTISRLIEFMLPLFGIWPGAWGMILCRLFWILGMFFTNLFHYRYFVTHLNADNFFDVVDCVCSFLAFSKIITKTVVFWINEDKLIEVLSMMVQDWDNNMTDKVDFRETLNTAKLSTRACNGMMIVHLMTGLTYPIGAFVGAREATDRIEDLPFMLHMEYPFEVNTGRRYKVVMATQYVIVLACSLGSGVSNALLLSLALHVGGQINILNYWLSGCIPKEIGTTRKSLVTAAKIIQKHQRIIHFSENIESLFSYVALLQMILNSVLMCSLGFLMVTSIGEPDAVEKILRSLFFYAVTNVEAFVFCYVGEYLTNKSKEIGHAAYNSAWYNLKSEDSCLLLFMIIRSQKQLTLTAGKIMDLSLECFTSIMKASGSYLSVLLAMK